LLVGSLSNPRLSPDQDGVFVLQSDALPPLPKNHTSFADTENELRRRWQILLSVYALHKIAHEKRSGGRSLTIVLNIPEITPEQASELRTTLNGLLASPGPTDEAPLITAIVTNPQELDEAIALARRTAGELQGAKKRDGNLYGLIRDLSMIGAASVAEIQKMSGLSASTIRREIKSLKKLGLIEDAGFAEKAPSTPGPPARRVRLVGWLRALMDAAGYGTDEDAVTGEEAVLHSLDELSVPLLDRFELRDDQVDDAKRQVTQALLPLIARVGQQGKGAAALKAITNQTDYPDLRRMVQLIAMRSRLVETLSEYLKTTRGRNVGEATPLANRLVNRIFSEKGIHQWPAPDFKMDDERVVLTHILLNTLEGPLIEFLAPGLVNEELSEMEPADSIRRELISVIQKFLDDAGFAQQSVEVKVAVAGDIAAGFTDKELDALHEQQWEWAQSFDQFTPPARPEIKERVRRLNKTFSDNEPFLRELLTGLLAEIPQKAQADMLAALRDLENELSSRNPALAAWVAELQTASQPSDADQLNILIDHVLVFMRHFPDSVRIGEKAVVESRDRYSLGHAVENVGVVLYWDLLTLLADQGADDNDDRYLARYVAHELLSVLEGILVQEDVADRPAAHRRLILLVDRFVARAFGVDLEYAPDADEKTMTAPGETSTGEILRFGLINPRADERQAFIDRLTDAVMANAKPATDWKIDIELAQTEVRDCLNAGTKSLRNTDWLDTSAVSASGLSSYLIAAAVLLLGENDPNFPQAIRDNPQIYLDALVDNDLLQEMGLNTAQAIALSNVYEEAKGIVSRSPETSVADLQRQLRVVWPSRTEALLLMFFSATADAIENEKDRGLARAYVNGSQPLESVLRDLEANWSGRNRTTPDAELNTQAERLKKQWKAQLIVIKLLHESRNHPNEPTADIEAGVYGFLGFARALAVSLETDEQSTPSYLHRRFQQSSQEDALWKAAKRAFADDSDLAMPDWPQISSNLLTPQQRVRAQRVVDQLVDWNGLTSEQRVIYERFLGLRGEPLTLQEAVTHLSESDSRVDATAELAIAAVLVRSAGTEGEPQAVDRNLRLLLERGIDAYHRSMRDDEVVGLLRQDTGLSQAHAYPLWRTIWRATQAADDSPQAYVTQIAAPVWRSVASMPLHEERAVALIQNKAGFLAFDDPESEGVLKAWLGVDSLPKLTLQQAVNQLCTWNPDLSPERVLTSLVVLAVLRDSIGSVGEPSDMMANLDANALLLARGDLADRLQPMLNHASQYLVQAETLDLWDLIRLAKQTQWPWSGQRPIHFRAESVKTGLPFDSLWQAFTLAMSQIRPDMTADDIAGPAWPAQGDAAAGFIMHGFDPIERRIGSKELWPTARTTERMKQDWSFTGGDAHLLAQEMDELRTLKVEPHIDLFKTRLIEYLQHTRGIDEATARSIVHGLIERFFSHVRWYPEAIVAHTERYVLGVAGDLAVADHDSGPILFANLFRFLLQQDERAGNERSALTYLLHEALGSLEQRLASTVTDSQRGDWEPDELIHRELILLVDQLLQEAYQLPSEYADNVPGSTIQSEVAQTIAPGDTPTGKLFRSFINTQAADRRRREILKAFGWSEAADLAAVEALLQLFMDNSRSLENSTADLSKLVKSDDKHELRAQLVAFHVLMKSLGDDDEPADMVQAHADAIARLMAQELAAGTVAFPDGLLLWFDAAQAQALWQPALTAIRSQDATTHIPSVRWSQPAPSTLTPEQRHRARELLALHLGGDQVVFQRYLGLAGSPLTFEEATRLLSRSAGGLTEDEKPFLLALFAVLVASTGTPAEPEWLSRGLRDATQSRMSALVGRCWTLWGSAANRIEVTDDVVRLLATDRDRLPLLQEPSNARAFWQEVLQAMKLENADKRLADLAPPAWSAQSNVFSGDIAAGYPPGALKDIRKREWDKAQPAAQANLPENLEKAVSGLSRMLPSKPERLAQLLRDRLKIDDEQIINGLLDQLDNFAVRVRWGQRAVVESRDRYFLGHGWIDETNAQGTLFYVDMLNYLLEQGTPFTAEGETLFTVEAARHVLHEVLAPLEAVIAAKEGVSQQVAHRRLILLVDIYIAELLGVPREYDDQATPKNMKPVTTQTGRLHRAFIMAKEPFAGALVEGVMQKAGVKEQPVLLNRGQVDAEWARSYIHQMMMPGTVMLRHTFNTLGQNAGVSGEGARSAVVAALVLFMGQNDPNLPQVVRDSAPAFVSALADKNEQSLLALGLNAAQVKALLGAYQKAQEVLQDEPGTTSTGLSEKVQFVWPSDRYPLTEAVQVIVVGAGNDRGQPAPRQPQTEQEITDQLLAALAALSVVEPPAAEEAAALVEEIRLVLEAA